MANVRDLMTPEDALDMEQRFDALLREHNDQVYELREGFRSAQKRAVLDWDLDLPEDFFDL